MLGNKANILQGYPALRISARFQARTLYRLSNAPPFFLFFFVIKSLVDALTYIISY